MTYTQLFIFVEGSDDKRFIDTIIKPRLKENYAHIKIIEYAQLKMESLINQIKAIKNQKSSDYLFFCDMDARGNKSLCISIKKETIIKNYKNILDFEKIVVVREEIESWYLAGMTPAILHKFKMKYLDKTDFVSKEEFERMQPKKFTSSNDFMVEILKNFSFEEAQKANTSFEYLMRKYIS